MAVLVGDGTGVVRSTLTKRLLMVELEGVEFGSISRAEVAMVRGVLVARVGCEAEAVLEVGL